MKKHKRANHAKREVQRAEDRIAQAYEHLMIQLDDKAHSEDLQVKERKRAAKAASNSQISS